MATDAPQIAVHGISVRYANRLALDGIDLKVAAGEVVVLLGASGSGKTTLLRTIAGFTPASAGSVWLGGRDVSRAAPHARGLGLVVQNYALFPHLRVADNVAFGLRARKRSRADIARTVRRFLAMTGMQAFAERYPHELSGGQQQRVAIARALAIEPCALLLDEPLSALDAPLRAGMLEELRRLHAQLPEMAIVYVTHDQTEAITIGHRIVLLRDGRIAAVGTPRALHDAPPNPYTAEFFGQANLLPAQRIEASAIGARIAVRVAGQTVWATQTAATPQSGALLMCVRPHDLRLGERADNGNDNGLRVLARSVQWLGAIQRLVADLEDLRVRADLPAHLTPPHPGEALTLAFEPSCAVLLGDSG